MNAASLPSTSHAFAARPTTAATVRLLPVAGLVYVLSWLVGLVVAPAAPKETASAAAISAYVVAHAGAVAVQSLLVHGLAGVALLALALGMGCVFRRDRLLGGWVTGTGAAAAAVSFLQVGLALVNCWRADVESADTSKALFTAVNYADTAKLVLLASFAATATYAAGRAGAMPRWLQLTGRLLAPLLVLGGLAFLVDSAVLTAALDLSLVVLLVWTGAASWTIWRRTVTP